jgi:antitoxin YobK
LSSAEFPDGSVVALAPVGTGDFWGFPVKDGQCRGEVWFY